MEDRRSRELEPELFGLVFRQKPVELLLELRNIEIRKQNLHKCGTDIARKASCTYPYMLRLLQELEQKGVVSSEKKGRERAIRLTAKGNEIARHIEKLQAVF